MRPTAVGILLVTSALGCLPVPRTQVSRTFSSGSYLLTTDAPDVELPVTVFANWFALASRRASWWSHLDLQLELVSFLGVCDACEVAGVARLDTPGGETLVEEWTFEPGTRAEIAFDVDEPLADCRRLARCDVELSLQLHLDADARVRFEAEGWLTVSVPFVEADRIRIGGGFPD